MLNKNHRQGADGEYADILNRIREGNISEADLDVLKTRVRPVNHPDIPKEALIVTCTNKEVNRINDEKLSEIMAPQYTLEAINRSQTKKVLNPLIDTTGAIRNTPLQKIIKLKISAKVVLTYNIDTIDSLTNGAFGEVLGIDFENSGNVSRVIVHFYDEKCGYEKRKNHVTLQQKYPGKNCIPIERMEFHYTLSKKQSTGVKNAIAIQFPLRLAFAATAHKVQGQTVKKTNNLVIDLRTVREAAQAYVMLSRVQSLGQLIILDSDPAEKIYSSVIALEELDRLKSKSLNGKRSCKRYILSCNVRSLKAHYHDILSSPHICNADVICLQETWLSENFDFENQLEIPGFTSHFCSAGRGKGIVTYCRENYRKVSEIKKENHQLLAIASSDLDIINIYRSSSSICSTDFLDDLTSVFDNKKETFVVGDFNICFKAESNHPMIEKLKSLKFQQRVQLPTHVLGRYIDHVYHFLPNYDENETIIDVLQFGQFFTDHDILLVEIPER